MEGVVRGTPRIVRNGDVVSVEILNPDGVVLWRLLGEKVPDGCSLTIENASLEVPFRLTEVGK